MNYVDLSNVELSILESVWDNEAQFEREPERPW